MQPRDDAAVEPVEHLVGVELLAGVPAAEVDQAGLEDRRRPRPPPRRLHHGLLPRLEEAHDGADAGAWADLWRRRYIGIDERKEDERRGNLQ